MLPDPLVTRMHAHLRRIYGETAAATVTGRLAEMVEIARANRGRPERSGVPLFDERDTVLVAYGDQVSEPGRAPLATLREFLARHTRGVVSGLHLLPHYPATSDDGFAVADFAAVDPALGSWQDVEALGDDYRLMLDAVFNHTSAAHPWLRGWLAADPAYDGYYHALDPATDLSAVVRPRTTPLLTPFPAADGTRHAWTTFSADQVDLNYANPEVLLAVTEQLLRYLAHGARMIRLDAVAFLWKEVGTSCIHLPQTHEIVRLWRTVIDAVAPGTVLVTETNVPHAENLGYLGAGDDEAHLVYQFALPPLTLSAFHRGSARTLAEWAAALRAPGPDATFLNFLASHDGIGLRAVEGLLSEAEIEQLCDAVVGGGGRVSYRSDVGGDRPYELNATYLDALGGRGEEPRRQVDRFLAAHSILLALSGVPLLYFHSLFGSRNWVEGAQRTGQPRTINRRKHPRAELEAALADPTSLRRAVRDALTRRIAVRTRQPAFSPGADQRVLQADAAYFALQRTPAEGGGSLVCVHDVSGRPGRFRARPADRLPAGARLVDVCDGTEHVAEVDGTVDVDLPAYGVRWLRTG